MGKKYWNKQEIDILKEFYPKEGCKVRERLPGKSDQAIRLKALRLNLSVGNVKPEKLLPCPFCGSEPVSSIEIRDSIYNTAVSLAAIVKCSRPDCGTMKGFIFAPTSFDSFEEAKSEVTRMWNRRADIYGRRSL